MKFLGTVLVVGTKPIVVGTILDAETILDAGTFVFCCLMIRNICHFVFFSLVIRNI